MDDLDGDGRVTLDDAQALAGVVDSLVGLKGGLGAYGTTTEHGPFVHKYVVGPIGVAQDKIGAKGREGDKPAVGA